MEDLVESLTRDNVTEVKVVLASVVVALAVYQVVLMVVGYGKLKLPFLTSRAASFTHRSVGDTIVVITLIVAIMCLSYFGFEAEDDEDTRALLHVISGSLLLGVIALKVVVVRWWHSMGRHLPALGSSVFILFVLTWLTSAGDYLWGW